jgi:hypothetical protein
MAQRSEKSEGVNVSDTDARIYKFNIHSGQSQISENLLVMTF